MPEASTKDRVSRLLEMVVEEVSLVDRAANKRRFLIVKRSDGMDDTSNETAPVDSDINAPAAGGDTGAALEDAGPEGLDTPEVTEAEATEAREPLVAAVAALEGLTEAVELLGRVTPEDAKSRLGELASELQTVAARLAEAVGVSDDEATTPGVDTIAGEDNKAAGGGVAPPEAQSNPLTSAVDSIRATLQRVSATLAPTVKSTKAATGDSAGPKAAGPKAAGPKAAEPKAPKPDAPKTAAPKADANAPSAATTGPLKEQLGALITTLQSLTSTVKEQQQRLARLEKRFGLPNSQPAGEQTPAPGVVGSSWPMDLNQPVDRESVDKAVSFHDI